MSQALLNQAIVALAEEHMQQLCELLGQKASFNAETMDEVKAEFMEGVRKQHPAKGKKKSKRASTGEKKLNPFQLFLKTESARIKAEEPDFKGNIFERVGREWQEKKAAAA